VKTKSLRKVINAPSDIVRDTAILLQRVGVVNIGEAELLNTIHTTIDAQSLVNHAADLFLSRKQQGLITFNELMRSLVQEAA
jgi:H2-forming N5,N10-methylenetetrahydromethanopterin dehydrogenase-like enzyme